MSSSVIRNDFILSLCEVRDINRLSNKKELAPTTKYPETGDISVAHHSIGRHLPYPNHVKLATHCHNYP
jgi:hypothetical protein